jgi:hypothetical protein
MLLAIRDRSLQYLKSSFVLVGGGFQKVQNDYKEDFARDGD